MSRKYPEFPFVICDKDGVVDRAASREEAEAYVASMPAESLTFYDEREQKTAARRVS